MWRWSIPVQQLSWCLMLHYRQLHEGTPRAGLDLEHGRDLMHELGAVQDFTSNTVMPQAEQLADQLPGAAEDFNSKLERQTEQLLTKLQGQVWLPVSSHARTALATAHDPAWLKQSRLSCVLCGSPVHAHAAPDKGNRTGAGSDMQSGQPCVGQATSQALASSCMDIGSHICVITAL